MLVGTNTACARRWGQQLGQDLGLTTLHSEEARMAARAQPKKSFCQRPHICSGIRSLGSLLATQEKQGSALAVVHPGWSST